eukprot:TCALIF_14056-PA protein Name:"Similar to dut Deoxyuridine 5'-triphosphate nucleotidohydrolase (Ehrlichia canis (strain Jake))" AED:0.38 eAED:0.38 QI:0/0/0/0.5/1/1/2/0/301
MLQEGDWVFKYRANNPSESGISRKTATYHDGPFQVQEIINGRQIKLRKSISGLGLMSQTVTEIVCKDSLTKAHPWELSRLQTPFTWTIAKATKQPPAQPDPNVPSSEPLFNLTPLATSATPKSDPDPAPNPVDAPEQQPTHSLMDDDSTPMPQVNTEPEPRVAPKRKARVDIFVPGNHHLHSEVITLSPGVPTQITTAIRIRVVLGFYLQLAPRSLQAAQGITVLGGIINPDYTGHIHLYLINITHQAQHWAYNRAIAQLLVYRQVYSDMRPSGPAVRMENTTPAKDRGTRCEGSSNPEAT